MCINLTVATFEWLQIQRDGKHIGHSATSLGLISIVGPQPTICGATAPQPNRCAAIPSGEGKTTPEKRKVWKTRHINHVKASFRALWGAVCLCGMGSPRSRAGFGVGGLGKELGVGWSWCHSHLVGTVFWVSSEGFFGNSFLNGIPVWKFLWLVWIRSRWRRRELSEGGNVRPGVSNVQPGVS